MHIKQARARSSRRDTERSRASGHLPGERFAAFRGARVAFVVGFVVVEPVFFGFTFDVDFVFVLAPGAEPIASPARTLAIRATRCTGSRSA